ncbi:hypothetical protein HOP52_04405 [Halomonas campisalis]|uniref:Uncharacterized protein n=1 Tax=Billgrantia campisalis TaxID=74661 RepID=A0ABS9P5G9_9GAMM|nr:hypothetical protein [Halomonas campisalis]MCG6657018.1 hypothetical protein [Halomonas campisalis]MDR5862203.1 hypothetical protein [Halomonas campisalis]
MKYQKTHRQLDEREKLRQFRELDDAFAQALRELDDPKARPEIPTGPPVRSLEAQQDDERSRQQAFEQRLKALMTEYAQPRESVAFLLRTLKSLGRIA